MTTHDRWTQRLVARRVLLGAARKRYHDKPSRTGAMLVRAREAQVSMALRILARHPATVTGISPVGVAMIAEFEGCSLKPYQDSVGVWTLGYGHVEGVSRSTPPLRSVDAAKLLLQRDLDRKYAPYVAALGLPLTQPQFDALTSFIFNVGPGGIGPGTGVGRALRLHDWRAAADHLLDWNKAGGNVLAGLDRRRHAERNLFLKGTK